MIFIIPIIAGAIALGSAAVGLAKGKEGIDKINEAKKVGKIAQKRHQLAVNSLHFLWEDTNRVAASYGELQVRIRQGVIARFISFIERIGSQASANDLRYLEGLDGLSVEQIKEYQTELIQGAQIAGGFLKATASGFMAGTGAVGVANAMGTVTTTVVVPQFFGLFTKTVVTEVAVSELGMAGVAAWLGGGSAALGGAVLGGIAIGPALAVGGFQVAGKAEQVLTESKEYEKKVDEQIVELEKAETFLKQVKSDIKESGRLLCSFETRALKALDELESHPFNPYQDAAQFQQVCLLVKALAEIMRTSILDEQGNLNPLISKIYAKYKK